MPHPKGGYKLADGSRVPGVTTIIGRFKDAGGLIHWSWQCGIDGIDYRAVRDSAADAGTLAHSFVEQHIKGIPDETILANVDGQEPDKRAEAAYRSYLTWERHTKLKIVEQETSMVSELHKFGGTLDAIGEIDGQLCLLDWKSSNALYRDMLVQIAAYKYLWEEVNFVKNKRLEGGFHLCRFSKEHGDFAHHYYPNLDEAWEQFLLFRRAYEIDKMLKKRAA